MDAVPNAPFFCIKADDVYATHVFVYDFSTRKFLMLA